MSRKIYKFVVPAHWAHIYQSLTTIRLNTFLGGKFHDIHVSDWRIETQRVAI